MDFLLSLGIEDLPEQQTRIPKSFSSDPNFDLKLGFDACCSSGKVLTEKFVECNPRWVEDKLLVRSKVLGNSEWLEGLCRVMWYLFKFSKFSDSRWCTLGKSCRALVCGWIVGLDHSVALLLKTKASSDHYLGGYGRMNLQLKKFCVVTAMAGYVPDSFLAMLLEDDRVC